MRSSGNQIVRAVYDFETAEGASGSDSIVMTPTTQNLSDDPSGSAALAGDEPASGVRLVAEPGPFDARAFQAFVIGQWERLEEWAHMLRVPVADLEDLAQEALLRLWQRRAAVAAASWPAWLWKALLMRKLQHFRTRRRLERRDTTLAILLQQAGVVRSPEIELHFEHCERELRGLVEALRPERRAVVELYLLDELSMTDVASRLRLGENTAKNRWRLARADMRAMFDRQRASERFHLARTASAALFALFALLVAFWNRLTGAPRRRAGPLFACAALAFVVSHHESSAEVGSTSDGAAGMAEGLLSSGGSGETAPSPWRVDYAFAFPQSALAEPEREGRRAPVQAVDREVPRRLLVSATAALKEGHWAAARAWLSEYKVTYPSNPFPQQYARLLREATMH